MILSIKLIHVKGIPFLDNLTHIEGMPYLDSIIQPEVMAYFDKLIKGIKSKIVIMTVISSLVTILLIGGSCAVLTKKQDKQTILQLIAKQGVAQMVASIIGFVATLASFINYQLAVILYFVALVMWLTMIYDILKNEIKNKDNVVAIVYVVLCLILLYVFYNSISSLFTETVSGMMNPFGQY